MMTGIVCFKERTTICNAEFGDWGIMGTGGQNMWSKVPYLESPILIFFYSLCNFYGATMMIKGSLLLKMLSIFGRKKTVPFWAKM